MRKLFLKVYFYFTSKIQAMLKARDYARLLDERNRVLDKFKKELIDPDNKHMLGDLIGYFTNENMTIDKEAGKITFSVGDYKFIVQARIFQKASTDTFKTNKVVFQTYEHVVDLYRLQQNNDPIRHVAELDIKLHYANKNGYKYGNATQRVSYSNSQFDSEYDITENILPSYCKKLILYIEGIETPPYTGVAR